MQKLPDAKEVVQHIQPMVPLLFRAIEGALQKTRLFFDNDKTEIDRCLAPNLFRFYAKALLASEGQRATYEEETDRADYELEVLANNGLCLSYGKHEIRILKSYGDELPAPGHSRARKKFWNWNGQMPIPFTYGESQTVASPDDFALHLIVLWDVEPTKYTLNKIRLACPIQGGESKDSVVAHFIEELAHPLESLKAIPMIEAEPPVEDLDLELKEQTDDKRGTSETGS